MNWFKMIIMLEKTIFGYFFSHIDNYDIWYLIRNESIGNYLSKFLITHEVLGFIKIYIYFGKDFIMLK